MTIGLRCLSLPLLPSPPCPCTPPAQPIAIVVRCDARFSACLHPLFRHRVVMSCLLLPTNVLPISKTLRTPTTTRLVRAAMSLASNQRLANLHDPFNTHYRTSCTCCHVSCFQPYSSESHSRLANSEMLTTCSRTRQHSARSATSCLRTSTTAAFLTTRCLCV